MSPDAALPSLLIFGEALTDFVQHAAGQWQSAPGGSCWNVARVAATLGVRCGWAGAVSSDLFGQEIASRSRAAGLDMRFVQIVDRPPLIAMVHRTNPPDYFFLGSGTADLAFDATRLPKGWNDACRMAHFGCISLVRQPLADTLVHIARSLRHDGVRISFDANYRNLMGPDYPAFFEEMVVHADIVKVSDEDLQHIYPDRPLPDVIAQLRKRASHAWILYTCGAKGLTLFTGEGAAATHRQEAFPVQVADTVGAGDACIGGLLASLTWQPDAPPATHLRFAAATAAAACTRTGAYAPSRAVVEALLSMPSAAEA